MGVASVLEIKWEVWWGGDKVVDEGRGDEGLSVDWSIEKTA